MARYPMIHLASFICLVWIQAIASAAETDWHAEIAHLASTNPQPKITEPTEEPIFDKSFRWEDGEKRIMAKVKYISAHAEEALPFLVAHVGDKEYAVTHESGNGYWSNMSVGDLCCEIIHHSIEARSDLISQGNNRKSRALVGHGPKEIQKWWQPRSKQPLHELQLEWLKVAVQVERETEPLDEDAKEQIRELQAELTRLGTTGKPLPTTYSFRLRQP